MKTLIEYEETIIETKLLVAVNTYLSRPSETTIKLPDNIEITNLDASFYIFVSKHYTEHFLQLLAQLHQFKVNGLYLERFDTESIHGLISTACPGISFDHADTTPNVDIVGTGQPVEILFKATYKDTNYHIKDYRIGGVAEVLFDTGALGYSSKNEEPRHRPHTLCGQEIPQVNLTQMAYFYTPDDIFVLGLDYLIKFQCKMQYSLLQTTIEIHGVQNEWALQNRKAGVHSIKCGYKDVESATTLRRQLEKARETARFKSGISSSMLNALPIHGGSQGAYCSFFMFMGGKLIRAFLDTGLDATRIPRLLFNLGHDTVTFESAKSGDSKYIMHHGFSSLQENTTWISDDVYAIPFRIYDPTSTKNDGLSPAYVWTWSMYKLQHELINLYEFHETDSIYYDVTYIGTDFLAMHNCSLDFSEMTITFYYDDDNKRMFTVPLYYNEEVMTFIKGYLDALKDVDNGRWELLTRRYMPTTQKTIDEAPPIDHEHGIRRQRTGLSPVRRKSATATTAKTRTAKARTAMPRRQASGILGNTKRQGS